MHYVYLIKCLNGDIYTGSTNNPFRRLNEHKTGIGGVIHTSMHGVSKLIHIESYATWEESYKREWEIKLWDKQSKLSLSSGNLGTPTLSPFPRKYIPKTNPFIKPRNLMSEANLNIFKKVLAA